jgi:hypothetical protein
MLREEMMDRRRLDVDKRVRTQAHYVATQIQLHRQPGTGKLLHPNSAPRPTACLPETRIESTAQAIGALGFEENFASLAFEGEHEPRRDEAASTMRHRTTISTMSTMSIPAPPYSLSDDPQSSASHYR